MNRAGSALVLFTLICNAWRIHADCTKPSMLGTEASLVPDKTTYIENDFIEVICEDATLTSGSPFSFCQGGTFNPPLSDVICERNCDDPAQDQASLKKTGMTYQHHDVVNFACAENYGPELTGPTESTCRDGSWDPAPSGTTCRAPCESPQFADPEGVYMDGEGDTFTCTLEPETSATMECSDGTWSDETFQCPACMKPEDTDANISLDPDQAAYNADDYIMVSCAEGSTQTSGFPYAYCTQSGNLDPLITDVVCSLSCSDPALDQPTLASTGEMYAHHDVQVLQCAENHNNLIGPESVTCQNGAWDPDPNGTRCEAPCMTPTGATPNGVYLSGSSETFTCDSNGDSVTLECDNGVWSDQSWMCSDGVSVTPQRFTEIITGDVSDSITEIGTDAQTDMLSETVTFFDERTRTQTDFTPATDEGMTGNTRGYTDEVTTGITESVTEVITQGSEYTSVPDKRTEIFTNGGTEIFTNGGTDIVTDYINTIRTDILSTPDFPTEPATASLTESITEVNTEADTVTISIIDGQTTNALDTDTSTEVTVTDVYTDRQTDVTDMASVTSILVSELQTDGKTEIGSVPPIDPGTEVVTNFRSFPTSTMKQGTTITTLVEGTDIMTVKTEILEATSGTAIEATTASATEIQTNTGTYTATSTIATEERTDLVTVSETDEPVSATEEPVSVTEQSEPSTLQTDAVKTDIVTEEPVSATEQPEPNTLKTDVAETEIVTEQPISVTENSDPSTVQTDAAVTDIETEDPVTETVTEVQVGINFLLTWVIEEINNEIANLTTELQDPTSTAYIGLVAAITNAVNEIITELYGANSLISISITDLRAGSIIVDFELTLVGNLSITAEDLQASLIEFITENGGFANDTSTSTSFTLDPNLIKVTDPTATPTDSLVSERLTTNVILTETQDLTSGTLATEVTEAATEQPEPNTLRTDVAETEIVTEEPISVTGNSDPSTVRTDAAVTDIETEDPVTETVTEVQDPTATSTDPLVSERLTTNVILTETQDLTSGTLVTEVTAATMTGGAGTSSSPTELQTNLLKNVTEVATEIQTTLGTEIATEQGITTPDSNTDIATEQGITTPDSNTDIATEQGITTPDSNTDIATERDITTLDSNTDIATEQGITTPESNTDIATEQGITTPDTNTDIATEQGITTPDSNTDITEQGITTPAGNTNIASERGITTPDSNTDIATEQGITTPDGKTDIATEQGLTTPDSKTDMATEQGITTPDSNTDIATEQGITTPDSNTDIATEQGISTPDGNTDIATEQGITTLDSKTDAATEQGITTPDSKTDAATEQGITTPDGKTDAATERITSAPDNTDKATEQATTIVPTTKQTTSYTTALSSTQVRTTRSAVPCGNDTCGAEEVCVESGGSSTCECLVGKTRQGGICTDQCQNACDYETQICEAGANDVYSCTCRPGRTLDRNGACSKTVEFLVTWVIEEINGTTAEFTNDYTDPTSEAYQQLVEAIRNAVYELLVTRLSEDSYIEININGFFSGSVGVEFVPSFKNEYTNSANELQNAMYSQILQDAEFANDTMSSSPTSLKLNSNAIAVEPLEIDECQIDHDCHADADCINTDKTVVDSGFTCECHDGFTDVLVATQPDLPGRDCRRTTTGTTNAPGGLETWEAVIIALSVCTITALLLFVSCIGVMSVLARRRRYYERHFKDAMRPTTKYRGRPGSYSDDGLVRTEELTMNKLPEEQDIAGPFFYAKVLDGSEVYDSDRDSVLDPQVDDYGRSIRRITAPHRFPAPEPRYLDYPSGRQVQDGRGAERGAAAPMDLVPYGAIGEGQKSASRYEDFSGRGPSVIYNDMANI